MPLNGPYSKYVQYPSSTDIQVHHQVSGHKTKPIGSQPTSYSSHHGVLNITERLGGPLTGLWDLNSGPCATIWTKQINMRDRADKDAQTNYNRAYARFRDDMRSGRASIGTFVAELPEAFGMITARAAWLTQGYHALKRGNFKEFCRHLSVRPHPDHRGTKWSAPKDAASLWLEYWLGWAPAVADLYDAAKAVTREDFSGRAKGRAHRPVYAVYKSAGTGSPTPTDRSEYTGHHYVRLEADWRMVNPNAALLDDLGLANPASIAFDLIPFSFIANWFGNLSQIMDAWTDGIGMQFSNGFNTSFMRGVSVHTYGPVRPDGTAPDQFAAKAQWFSARRNAGLPPLPDLVFRLPDGGLSLTRAATSCSLLASMFAKG